MSDQEVVRDAMPYASNGEGGANDSQYRAARITVPIKWRLLLGGLLLLAIVAIAKSYESSDASVTLAHFFHEALYLFISEFGVALMVAFLVGYFVEGVLRSDEARARERERLAEARIRESERAAEQRSRERESQEEERRRSLLAKNVVEGVYGIQHSPSYVKAVVETNLQSTIVRKGLDLEYKLFELSDDDIKNLNVKTPQRFVILRMLSSYSLVNLASYEQEVLVRYSVAVRHGQGMRDMTRLNRYRIGAESEAITDSSVIESFLIDPSDPDDKTYAWVQKIAGGQTLDLEFAATAIKEKSDNEVWGSFFPTIGTASFRLTAMPKMSFGARPLTSADVTRQRDDDTSAVWRSTKPILTNDSIVFWWRTPLDDGMRPAVGTAG